MYAVINNKRYVYNESDMTIGVMILSNGEWVTQAYSVKINNRIIIEMDDNVSDYDDINLTIRKIYNGEITLD